MTDFNSNRTAIATDAMGIEVSWSFGDGSAKAVQMSRDALRTICHKHGFLGDADIEDLGPVKALKRAVTLSPKRPGHTVKALARPNRDTPVAMGVYIRSEGEGEKGDGWTMGARVRVEGDDLVALPPEGDSLMHIGADAIACSIACTANTLIATAYNVDISNALVNIGSSIGWINRRRNSGGVYYLNAGPGAAAFAALLADIAAPTRHLHRNSRFVPEVVEVFARPLSKATIADAAEDHFERRIESLLAQLRDASTSGTMRGTTMEKRVDEIGDLMDQAADFGPLLANVAEINTTLANLQQVFTRGIAGDHENLVADVAALDALMPPTEAPKGPAAPAKAKPAPMAIMHAESGTMSAEAFRDMARAFEGV